MSTYQVTSPLVIVHGKDGGSTHVYQGGVFSSDGVNEEQLKQLLSDGMVEEFSPEGDDSDGPPAKSAPKADWEAYARSQGATDDDLEGQTKDDLVAAYGA